MLQSSTKEGNKDMLRSSTKKGNKNMHRNSTRKETRTCFEIQQRKETQTSLKNNKEWKNLLKNADDLLTCLLVPFSIYICIFTYYSIRIHI